MINTKEATIMKRKYISVILILALAAAFVSGSVYANGADPRQTYYDFSQPPTGAEAERAVTRAEFSGYLTAAQAEKGILAKNSGEPAFTDEESAYIQSEAETAASLGLGYDVPEYKTETYILYFDDLLETLDNLYV